MIKNPIINGLEYIIPNSKFSVDERQQRRLSFRNERHLYKRRCDLCKSEIVSVYSPDKPYIVYCSDCFWSDKWDSCDAGQDYDFNKSFFEQFKELNAKVPLLANMVFNSENSEFNGFCVGSKNCYMSSRVGDSEDIYYSYLAASASNCMDCFDVFNCKYCYECVDCWDSYNCKFCELCRNCSDCNFCYDCIGSSDCFGSVGLRNAKYCFFNEKLTKQQYDEKLKNYDLSSYQTLNKAKKDFKEFLLTKPFRNLYIVNSQNVVGNYIIESKDIYNSFDVISTNTASNSLGVEYSQDIYDCSYIYYGNNCYENISNSRSSNIYFSFATIKCYDLFYSMLCFNNSHDCFGCISMKGKSYCILNKQYTKEEYEKLVPRIIESMGGEWGEFFPPSLSHFGYNETLASNFFPITKEDVETKNLLFLQGFKWSDYEPQFPKVEKTIPADLLPDTINEIPNDILNWAILPVETNCNLSLQDRHLQNRPFQIIKPELDFYRKMNLPIPRLHPEQRHQNRMNARMQRNIFERRCDKCNKSIKSVFDTINPEKACPPELQRRRVYCEDCYLEEVY